MAGPLVIHDVDVVLGAGLFTRGKANRFRQMGGVKAMLHLESGQVEKNRKFKMGTAEIFEQAFGSLRI